MFRLFSVRRHKPRHGKDNLHVQKIKRPGGRTDPQGRDGVGVFVASVLLLQVVALGSLISLADFPQLDRFICQKEEKRKHARKLYHFCCRFRCISAAVDRDRVAVN